MDRLNQGVIDFHSGGPAQGPQSGSLLCLAQRSRRAVNFAAAYHLFEADNLCQAFMGPATSNEAQVMQARSITGIYSRDTTYGRFGPCLEELRNSCR